MSTRRTLFLAGALIPLGVAVMVLVAYQMGDSAGPTLPREGSVDAGFARDMSTHHAQAVEMAEIIRGRTTDEDVRILAVDIALTQQAQIGRMSGWLDVWGLRQSSSAPAMAWMGHATRGRMPGMASRPEIVSLREQSPPEADKTFLRLMIRHHQGGLPMAEAAVGNASRPEVRHLARAIATAQETEIRAMEGMLAVRGEPTPVDNQAHGKEHEGKGTS